MSREKPLGTGEAVGGALRGEVAPVLPARAEDEGVHAAGRYGFPTISMVGRGKIIFVPLARIPRSRSRNSFLKCQGSTR